jgi:hypothetical protein
MTHKNTDPSAVFNPNLNADTNPNGNLNGNSNCHP